jgi:hypothetical protein
MLYAFSVERSFANAEDLSPLLLEARCLAGAALGRVCLADFLSVGRLLSSILSASGALCLAPSGALCAWSGRYIWCVACAPAPLANLPGSGGSLFLHCAEVALCLDLTALSINNVNRSFGSLVLALCQPAFLGSASHDRLRQLLMTYHWIIPSGCPWTLAVLTLVGLSIVVAWDVRQ